MTGSGKTGLCLALLEEAAMDGIPVIAIDPKGDIGNALLTFPELSAAEFRPWINPDEARRKNLSEADFAEAQAASWKKGLNDWGQSGERIRKLRELVDMTIYTPGSSAGVQVSILASLNAPPAEVRDDDEALADLIESTVSSLLGLAGVEGDPVHSPEHALLSNIVRHAWKAGQNLSLESLIRFVQQPPFRNIGVVDVETFFPEGQRSALAMRLNNIVASPGFASWLQGDPLDIQRMFYTAEGKPRVSIFNIAHLGDSERMFFVSLLLNQLVGWMRTQQGTSSLRAILYMDEIFGYLPPSAMPPSKRPMLMLLKQARAFGLGILLATQNPVDLDYKALSNIGTWWLGRLQTERDKARVLDGLEGASQGGGAAYDRQRMDTLLSGLDTRVFLMSNVHEDGPVVFHVRWVMAYMTGPLARDQIRLLMDSRRSSKPARVAEADSGFLPPSARKDAGSGAGERDTLRPVLPEGASEFFVATDRSADEVTYSPAVLRSAVATFEDSRKGISGESRITLVNPIDVAGQRVLWDEFADVARDTDPAQFDTEPLAGAAFAALPGAALKSATYSALKKDFADWVYSNHRLEVFFSPALEMYSQPGEKLDEFRARATHAAREKRDEAVEMLREKTAKTARTLEDRAARAETKVATQKSQATTAMATSALTIGGSILGSLLGNKRGLGGLLKTRNVNAGARVHRESREAAAASEELGRVKKDMAELEAQLAGDVQKLRDQYEPSTLAVETVKLAPLKKNIRVTATGILWMPE